MDFDNVFMLSCCFLTFISTLVLITIFIFKQVLRTYIFQLVFMISLSDALYSLVWIVSIILNQLDIIVYEEGQNPDIIICNTQGFVLLFSSFSSFLWTASICYTLQKIIFKQYSEVKKEQRKQNNIGKNSNNQDYQQIEDENEQDEDEFDQLLASPIKHYFLFNTCIPFCLAIIPVIFLDYRKAKPFSEFICFLSSSNNNKSYIINFFIALIPYILILLYISIVCIRIIKLAKNKNLQLNSNLQWFVKSLIFYPSVLLFCWIWLLFRRLCEAFELDIPQFFDAMDFSIASLQGFFNTLGYGYLYWKTQKQSFYFHIDVENNSLILSSFNVSLEDEDEDDKYNKETEIQQSMLNQSIKFEYTDNKLNNRQQILKQQEKEIDRQNANKIKKLRNQSLKLNELTQSTVLTQKFINKNKDQLQKGNTRKQSGFQSTMLLQQRKISAKKLQESQFELLCRISTNSFLVTSNKLPKKTMNNNDNNAFLRQKQRINSSTQLDRNQLFFNKETFLNNKNNNFNENDNLSDRQKMKTEINLGKPNDFCSSVIHFNTSEVNISNGNSNNNSSSNNNSNNLGNNVKNKKQNKNYLMNINQVISEKDQESSTGYYQSGTDQSSMAQDSLFKINKNQTNYLTEFKKQKSQQSSKSSLYNEQDNNKLDKQKKDRQHVQKNKKNKSEFRNDKKSKQNEEIIRI